MAGGQWRLTLSPADGTVAVPGGVVANQAYPVVPTIAGFGPSLGFPEPAVNLLAYDKPTIMTAWQLTSLYLPVCARAISGTFSGVPILTVAIELLLNNQLVWSEAIALQSLVVPSTAVAYANGLFTADLVNSIVVERGSRLALRCKVTSNLASSGSASLGLGLALQGAATPPATQLPAEGVIGYTVQQLQGARQL